MKHMYRHGVTWLIAAGFAAGTAHATATPEQLEARVQELTEQLHALQAEITSMKAQQPGVAAATPAATDAAEPAAPARPRPRSPGSAMGK